MGYIYQRPACARNKQGFHAGLSLQSRGWSLGLEDRRIPSPAVSETDKPPLLGNTHGDTPIVLPLEPLYLSRSDIPCDFQSII